MEKLVNINGVYLVETERNCFRGIDWRFDKELWVNKALSNGQNITGKK